MVSGSAFIHVLEALSKHAAAFICQHNLNIKTSNIARNRYVGNVSVNRSCAIFCNHKRTIAQTYSGSSTIALMQDKRSGGIVAVYFYRREQRKTNKGWVYRLGLSLCGYGCEMVGNRVAALKVITQPKKQ